MALLSTQIDAADLLSFDKAESEHAARKAAARTTLTAAAVANAGGHCVMCLRDVLAGVAPPPGCKAVFTVAHVTAVTGPRDVRTAGGGAGSRMATLDICDETAAAQLPLWRDHTQVLAAAGGGPRGIRAGDVVLIAGVKAAAAPAAPASERFAGGAGSSLPRLSTQWQSAPVMLLARRRGSEDAVARGGGARSATTSAADAGAADDDFSDDDDSGDDGSAAGPLDAAAPGPSRHRGMEVAHPALHALAACLIAHRLGMTAGMAARSSAAATAAAAKGSDDDDDGAGSDGAELPCLATVLQLTATARTADAAQSVAATAGSALPVPASTSSYAPSTGMRAHRGRRPPVFTDTDAEAIEHDTVRAFPAISVSSFVKAEAWRCKLWWVAASGCSCASCSALHACIKQLRASPAAARSPVGAAASSRPQRTADASVAMVNCISAGGCCVVAAGSDRRSEDAATCHLVCRYAAVLQHTMLAEWTTLLPSLPTVTQSSLASQSTAAGALPGALTLRRWRWAPGKWVDTPSFLVAAGPSVPSAGFVVPTAIASGAELEAVADSGAVPASGVSLRVHVLAVAPAVGKDAVYTITTKGGEDVVCRLWATTVCLEDSPTLPLTLSVRQFAAGTHDAGKQQFDAFLQQLQAAREAFCETSTSSRARYASPASSSAARRPCFMLHAIRAERGRADGTLVLINTPHSRCERAAETSRSAASPACRAPAAGDATPNQWVASAADAAGSGSASGHKRSAATLPSVAAAGAGAAAESKPAAKRPRVEASPLQSGCVPRSGAAASAPISPLGGRVQAMSGFVEGIAWPHSRVFVGVVPQAGLGSASASAAGAWTELSRESIHLILQPYCSACKRDVAGWPASHIRSGSGARSSALLMCQSLDCATRASSRTSVVTGPSQRGISWRYAPAILQLLPCAATGQAVQLPPAAIVDAAAMRDLLAGISPKLVASSIAASAHSRLAAAAGAGAAAAASAVPGTSSSLIAAAGSELQLVEDAVMELLDALVHHDAGPLSFILEAGHAADSQSSDDVEAASGSGSGRPCQHRLLEVLPGEP